MRCLILILILLLASASARAGEVVFYRCTDAAGALTVQNMPCPKGTQQQSKKVMQAVETRSPPPPLASPAPATLPHLVAAPVPAAAPEPPKATAVATAPPVPLPELFQCRTREGQNYFSETSEPPSRCVAMQVTGLDGNPNTGAGDACEVMRDTCTAVDPALRCATWQQWVNDAESEWRFAAASQAETLREKHLRLQSLLAGSDCNTQKP